MKSQERKSLIVNIILSIKKLIEAELKKDNSGNLKILLSAISNVYEYKSNYTGGVNEGD